MGKKTIFIVFLNLHFLFSGFAALNSPEISCISINNEGDVILEWAQTTGPGPLAEFVQYLVFKSNSLTGTYNQIGAYNAVGSTVHVDIAGSPGLTPVYYYVITEFNDGTGNQTSLALDTVQPIILSTIATGSFGTLTWNQTGINNPVNPNYEVNRRLAQAGGVTSIIGNPAIGTEFFNDTNYNCSIRFHYQISVDGITGCKSTSNVDSLDFIDNDSPAIPFLDSISINPVTGEIIVGWQLSNSADAVSYLVTTDTTGVGNYRYDTLHNASVQGFTYFSFDSILVAGGAGIAAIDSCGNISATSFIQRTIQLSAIPNFCVGEVQLTWTPYVGWNPISYNIYVSADGAAFEFLTSVNGSETSFLLKEIDLTIPYIFFVRAIASGGDASSTSNPDFVELNIPQPPEYHHVNFVNVLNDSEIEVELLTDTSFPLSYYRLMRSIERDGPYQEITRDSALTVDTLFYMRDITANTASFPYFYQVEIVDSCNQVIFTSNISKSIHLKGDYHRIDGVVDMDWNFYGGWNAFGNGVSRYRLYRAFSERGDFTALDSFGLAKGDYQDQIFDLTPETSEFCYYIEAIENGPNAYGFTSLSRSNVVCFDDVPEVWIPTVFTPNNNGINETFRPMSYFIDGNTYSFQIFDRWGRIVFETNDPLAEWDGTKEGNVLPGGVYAYYLSIQDLESTIFEKRGIVRMIR